MKLPRRNFLHLAAGAAALSAVSGIAWAQTYPSRPITIVAPFPAGGATDIVSRTLAEGMKAPLGQTFWSRTSPEPAAPSVPAGSCVPNPMAIRWSSANGAAMSAPARSIDCRTTCSTISSRSRCSPLRRYGFSESAVLARHGHVAAHHARELARKGKAKSRPAEALRRGGVGLAELLEQLSLLLRSHANPSVSDGELDPAASVGDSPRPQPDLALLGELKGVAQ